jgi:hypothetical protein
MDIKQAGILLEKINALHRSMSLDKGEVSKIERDLMLSYVRQYYDALLMPAAYSSPLSRTVEQPVAPPAAKPTPPPEPAPEPEPLPQRVQVEPAKPTPPPPAPAPAPKPRAKSPAVAALFKLQAAKELSEKLGNQSIADLTKAMSINDKLLYANELFGRDMSAMNTKLHEFNGLSHWDAAEAELIALAEQHDWTEEERSEIAQSFIKLVRRRF